MGQYGLSGASRRYELSEMDRLNESVEQLRVDLGNNRISEADTLTAVGGLESRLNRLRLNSAESYSRSHYNAGSPVPALAGASGTYTGYVPSPSGGNDIPTSSISVVSHTHGRERRAERGIMKRELQEAIKKGRKERANPGRDGSKRWRYTYKGVVYITDDTSRHEVTSWRTEDAEDMPFIPAAPTNAASHVVVVVDNSGSMRKEDVPGYSCRTSAVYGCLAEDLVKPQLGKPFKLKFSLIEMSDEARVVLDRREVNKSLLEFLRRRGSNTRACSHGNYLPALTKALQQLKLDMDKHARLFLVFLSDGAPSDHIYRQCPCGVEVWQPCYGQVTYGKPKLQNCPVCGPKVRYALRNDVAVECFDLIKRMGDLFGLDRLYMGTVAFGPANEDYKVLQSMAGALPKRNSSFQKLGLSGGMLSTAFSSLSSSFTSMCTEAMETGGRRLTLRVVPGSTANNARQEYLEFQTVKKDDLKWDLYIGSGKCYKKQRWCPNAKRLVSADFSPVPQLFASDMKSGKPVARGVAHAKKMLACGAERMVFQCSEVVSFNNGQSAFFTGPKLVAKQTLHNEFVSDKRWHHRFCRTQAESEEFALLFNRRLQLGPSHQVHFLDCVMYTLVDSVYGAEDTGEVDILVEQELEGKWTKWNNNAGAVFKASLPKLAAAPAHDLGAILEEDEEEDDELGGEDLTLCVPQTFSHFTFVVSSRKKLVCDLQGVWNSTDGFLLTDPVIHHHANKKRNGATDKGCMGFRNFFRTHQCNTLCQRLGLEPVHPDSINANA